MYLSKAITGRGPVMSLDLDAIRARANAATDGPWYTDGPWLIEDGDDYCCPKALVMVTGPDRESIMVPERPDANDADAEFIAYARSDIPALLDEIERLQAILARVE